MLTQRAQRVMSKAKPESAKEEKPAQKLGTEKVLFLWQWMVNKLVRILLHLEAVDQTKAWLEDRVYDKLFKMGKSIITVQAKEEVTRVINGEIVGKPLQPRKGKVPPTVEAAVCQHPLKRDGRPVMVRGGNQSDKKDWTCRDCHSRWERHSAEEWQERTGTVLSSEQIVLFGKYAGHTYQEVLKDKTYCQWVVNTFEMDRSMCPGLEALALYLVEQEWQMAVDPTPGLDEALPDL